MTSRTLVISVVTVLAAALAAQSASALSMKECSAKYKAAQAAGTTQGMKWNDFRKAECGSGAAATPAAPPAASPPVATKAEKKEVTKAAPTPAALPGGNPVFPSAVSPKYSNESAGKARMHTCLDQYNANKATNGNAGLTWIAKGGGYYSECNKRLKS